MSKHRIIGKYLLLFTGFAVISSAGQEISVPTLFLDAAVAMFFFVLASIATSSWQKFALVFTHTLVLLVYVLNAEHIHALGSPMSLTRFDEAADLEFLQATLFNLHTPWWVILLASSSLIFWQGAKPVLPFSRRILASTTVLLVFSVAMVSYVRGCPIGERCHLITWNIVELSNLAEASDLDLSEGGLEDSSVSEKGVRIFEPQFTKPNLIMIFIEGLSGKYVYNDSPADDPIHSPNLARLSTNAFNARRLLALNRKTDNGLYSVFCSDRPTLLGYHSKFGQLRFGAKKPNCLPAWLQSLGYNTVFLQGSPLSYMHKDKVLPIIGFEDVKGFKELQPVDSKIAWGIGDREFFAKAEQITKELISEKKPFFLSLLTVGTHHPYTVPPGYEGKRYETDRETVFSIADQAVATYVTNIRKYDPDTIIVITGDESAYKDGQVLWRNWVPFILLGPGIPDVDNDNYVTQLDIAPTIADLLGKNPYRKEWLGRSLIRKYRSFRPIFLAHLNFRYAAKLQSKDQLILCDYMGAECSMSSLQQGEFLDGFSKNLIWENLAARDKKAIFTQILSLERPPDHLRKYEDVFVPPNSPGWFVEAYKDKGFGRGLFTRVVSGPSIHSPQRMKLIGLPEDNYSLRYVGCINLKKKERVKITLASDDGARLWINNKLTVDDDFSGHGLKPAFESVELQAGTHLFQIDYFEAWGAEYLIFYLEFKDFDRISPGEKYVSVPQRLRLTNGKQVYRCQ